MALVGHFNAVHPQEHFKPSEAMWLSTEMWGDVAKAHYSDIKKGHAFRGVGYIIQNKWVDKHTGEERKMYKLRITKVMAKEEFSEVSKLLDHTVDAHHAIGDSGRGDSHFSDEIPVVEDQTQLYERSDHLNGQQYRSPPVSQSYPFARGPSHRSTGSERARTSMAACANEGGGPDTADAATRRDGAAIWNLLENAKEGDYLPWWE